MVDLALLCGCICVGGPGLSSTHVTYIHRPRAGGRTYGRPTTSSSISSARPLAPPCRPTPISTMVAAAAAPPTATPATRARPRPASGGAWARPRSRPPSRRRASRRGRMKTRSGGSVPSRGRKFWAMAVWRRRGLLGRGRQRATGARMGAAAPAAVGRRRRARGARTRRRSSPARARRIGGWGGGRRRSRSMYLTNTRRWAFRCVVGLQGSVCIRAYHIFCMYVRYIRTSVYVRPHVRT